MFSGTKISCTVSASSRNTRSATSFSVAMPCRSVDRRTSLGSFSNLRLTGLLFTVKTGRATIGIRGTGGLIQVFDDGRTLLIGTSGVWTLGMTLAGLTPSSAAGRLLTAPTMQAHNTFAAPDTVRPVPFDGVKLAGAALTVTLPARSVAVIELR